MSKNNNEKKNKKKPKSWLNLKNLSNKNKKKKKRALQTGQGFIITNNIIFGSQHYDAIRVQANDNSPANVVMMYNTLYAGSTSAIRIDV